jgi:universal stress protein E
MAIKIILLAVRDPAHLPRPQLRKVASLAKALQASVELFHAINEFIPSSAITGVRRQHSSIQVMSDICARRTRQLERLSEAIADEGARIRVHAEWDFPPHEAVIRRALAIKADLVIATPQPHQLAGRLLLANTDWELIRHCPAPLLLLKSTRPYDRPGILVSVDPFHEHAKPAALDPLLLRSALEWARSLKGEVHAFHAHMPLAVKAAAAAALTPIAAWLPPEAEVTHTRVVRGELHRLAERAGIPDTRVHLRLGDALTELERIVKQLKPALVVMGAVSRSGLKRVFIGSTAEKAIDRVSCDVLIVKPKGFRTTVPARMPLSFKGASSRTTPKD